MQDHGLQHRAQSSGYVRSLNEKPVCIQGWGRVTPREPQLLTRRQGLNLAAGVVGRAMPFSEKVRVWTAVYLRPGKKLWLPLASGSI